MKEIKMNASLNEVVVRIHEVLDEAALHSLEEAVRKETGVISVGHNPEKSHMIMVVYDSESTRASSLLHSFEKRGPACAGRRHVGGPARKSQA
ncbi:MAG: hypothetical protein WA108_09950 [Thiobacillus sp.]